MVIFCVRKTTKWIEKFQFEIFFWPRDEEYKENMWRDWRETRVFVVFSWAERTQSRTTSGSRRPRGCVFFLSVKIKGISWRFLHQNFKTKNKLNESPQPPSSPWNTLLFFKRIFSLAGLYNNCISKNKKCLNTEFTYVFHFTWFLGEWRLIDDVLVAGVNIRWWPLRGDGVPSLYVLEQLNTQVFWFWIWIIKNFWFKHLYWRNV